MPAPTPTPHPRRRWTTRAAHLAATAALLATTACSTGDEADGGPERDRVPAHEAVTRADDALADTFEHRFAEVDGQRLHYVTGGDGPPLVLLHGWPQTWYAWKDVMPALAEQHTVYAVDLPGLGDSSGTTGGFDKATLARTLHTLVTEEIGHDRVDLAGHDLGAGVGFQYAAQFPDAVRRYAHLDYPLPGPALSATDYRTFLWHLAFNSQEEVPEALAGDDMATYLELFYPLVAAGGTAGGGPGAVSPFTDAEEAEFARTYAEADNATAGFGLYRTLDEDEADNIAAGPVDVPTLLMTAEGSMAATRPTVEPLLTDLADAVEVPGSGHWLMTENPDFTARRLLRHFAR